MALKDKTIVFDKLKPPFMGHALVDLLIDRGSNYEFSGSFSFTTEDEYKELKFIDTSLSEEDSDVDPWTGIPGNQRDYEDVKDFLPTWAEILAEHQDNLAEYAAYAGKRQREYPDWRDQLDLIYHDIDSGKLGEAAKTSEFYVKIKEIKDNNQ